MSPMAQRAAGGNASAKGAGPKLSHQVYEAIFESIVRGEFPKHSRLPSETELSQRFAASRPVVREALALLRDDGVVASRRGSGSYVIRRPDSAVLQFVPVGSLADVQRGFEFRIGLEGAAAALAAERWQEADLAAVKAALDELEEFIQTNQVGAEADARFHRAIAKATRNAFHLSVQESLEGHIVFGLNLARNLSLLRPSARLILVQQEHVRIFEAVEARDRQAAREAMEQHLRNAFNRVFEGVSGDDR